VVGIEDGLAQAAGAGVGGGGNDQVGDVVEAAFQGAAVRAAADVARLAGGIARRDAADHEVGAAVDGRRIRHLQAAVGGQQRILVQVQPEYGKAGAVLQVPAVPDVVGGHHVQFVQCQVQGQLDPQDV